MPSIKQLAVVTLLTIAAIAVGAKNAASSTTTGSSLTDAAGSVDSTASIDPEARTLLDDMTAAYRSLHSFTAHIKIQAGSPGALNSSISTVSYKKPNFAFIYTKSPSGTFKTISDGYSIYVIKPGDDREYEQMPCDAGPGTIAVAMRAGGASAIGLFPFAAAGSDPFTMLAHNLKSLTVLTPSTIGGVSVDVIQAVESAPGIKDATLTISIGQTDKLIRQVGFVSGNGHEIIETQTGVEVNPTLSSKIFHFVPPVGAKSIPLSPTQ